MLLPYMHGNLAQIGRVWLATCIMRSYIPPEPLQDILYKSPHPTFMGTTAASTPASLISWDISLSHTTLSSSPSFKRVSLANGTTLPASLARNPCTQEVRSTKVPLSSIQTSTLTPHATPNFPSSDTKPQHSIEGVINGFPTMLTALPLLRKITNVIRSIENRSKSPVPPLSQVKYLRGYSTTQPNTKLASTPKQKTLHSFFSLPVPSPLSDFQHGETWGHTMDKIDASTILCILLQNPKCL
jgi:hypothetical protein